MSDKNQRNLIISGVIIAILLIVIAFLVINNYSKGRENEVLTVELDEAQKLNQELETEYQNALDELEQLKGDNEQLNLVIEQQQEEITAQKERIARLISESNKLKEAKAELQKLRVQREQYVAEIERLKEENEQLQQANEELTQAKTNLEEQVASSEEEKQQLSRAKAELTTEKEKLESEKEALTKKVTFASTIKVSNIEVSPEMDKGDGKYKERRKADKVDRLKICFDVGANKVAEKGSEQFYLRIINPQGQTLAIEELGSGVMTNKATQQKVRYTSIKEVNYNQEEANTCTVWSPNVPFQEGKYDIEVYNKGYLAGRTAIELK